MLQTLSSPIPDVRSRRPRVWFITGASSGFGRLLTEIALNDGEIVVATARNPTADSPSSPSLSSLAAKFPPSQLLVHKCDVSVKEDVLAAFRKTYEAFGRCDVVFNNAAVAYISELEGSGVIASADITTNGESGVEKGKKSLDDASRKLFNINFWGAANVSLEAVRVFRDLNPPGEGGLLLNVSAGGGHFGVPGIGYYCASKHALEGLSDTLAKEVDPKWNIKISIIQPGSFNTRILSTDGMPVYPPHPAYATNPNLPTLQLRQAFFSPQGVPMGDARKAAEKMYELSKIERPPLYFAIGKDCIGGMRGKLERVSKELDEYESWSEGLQIN